MDRIIADLLAHANFEKGEKCSPTWRGEATESWGPGLKHRIWACSYEKSHDTGSLLIYRSAYSACLLAGWARSTALVGLKK